MKTYIELNRGRKNDSENNNTAVVINSSSLKSFD